MDSYQNGEWEYKDNNGYYHRMQEIDEYAWERKYKLTK